MADGLSITIGSLGELGRLTAAAEAFFEAHHIPNDTRARAFLTLDELVANIFGHGYPDGAEGAYVSVQIERLAEELMLTVTDGGVPFDPFVTADPNTGLGLDDRPIGGLGLYLIRRLVKRSDYAREGDVNRTRLSLSI